MCHDTPEESATVRVPEHVRDRIERRLPQTRFDSVDAYAAVALDLLLKEVERSADEDEREGGPESPAGESEASETGSRRDDAVRRRLESLGYL